MSKRPEPDRRTKVGAIYVDLWEGVFQDTICVWRDVFPALGGLIYQGKVRRKESAAAYERAIEAVKDV